MAKERLFEMLSREADSNAEPLRHRILVDCPIIAISHRRTGSTTDRLAYSPMHVKTGPVLASLAGLARLGCDILFVFEEESRFHGDFSVQVSTFAFGCTATHSLEVKAGARRCGTFVTQEGEVVPIADDYQ
jgi:hypothetical protein